MTSEQAALSSGEYLIREIASLVNLPASIVFDAMVKVPENMLALLDSPQGWTALAGYVASQFGIEPPDYKPTIH